MSDEMKEKLMKKDRTLALAAITVLVVVVLVIFGYSNMTGYSITSNQITEPMPIGCKNLVINMNCTGTECVNEQICKEYLMSDENKKVA